MDKMDLLVGASTLIRVGMLALVIKLLRDTFRRNKEGK